MTAVQAIDRLLVPVVHEVLAVVDEIPGVVTLRVAPVNGAPAPFLPAQVCMVGAFGVGEAALSITSPATEIEFHEYTIRRAGAITSALTSLRPGDQCWVRGPFGSAWDLDVDGRDVVIAAGGIGLAPLRSAVYALLRERERYGHVVLVVGARSSRLLLYGRDHETWREHGLAVLTTIDEPEPGWSGRVGLAHEAVGAAIADLDLDPARITALLCGPDPMMRCTADLLVDRGVDPTQVQLTLERNMQCGNALCGHCQLGPVIVCRDGPVVRYPTVADSMRVEER